MIVSAYQDESPVEVETEKGREPFKDVEAQKIRDDVTIQVRFKFKHRAFIRHILKHHLLSRYLMIHWQGSHARAANHRHPVSL